MAVTPTTMAELNDLAKDYYSDVYQQVYNPETPLKTQFARLENIEYAGRKLIFGVKTNVGGGSSNAGANKTLPAAGQGQYAQGEAQVIRQYTRMALDGLLIEATKRRTGSYRPALADTMEDRLQAHDLETNRQLFSNGDGKLCLINGAGAASATQSVRLDYGVTNGGPGTRHVSIGDQVALYSAPNTLIGRRVVVDVDHDAGTIDLDSSITSTANTNFFTKSTADDDNFTTGELNGLLASCGTGTFEGITDTGANNWRANVHSNGDTIRPLTDELVVRAVEKHRMVSRKYPDLAVCRPGVVLKYSLLFLPIRRIDGQDAQLKGGFKPVNELLGGGSTRIPVLTDPDCPSSRLFLITKAAKRMADLLGTEWFDMDGAQFDRINDKDGIEGFLRSYKQLVTIQRNALSVITDIEDDSFLERTV